MCATAMSFCLATPAHGFRPPRHLLQMSFDLSLARGLDYYTGIIYEAVTAESAPPGAVPSALEGAVTGDAAAAKGAAPVPNGSNPEDEDAKVGVGSIAAGGRYDNLVAMFSSSGQQIPCVGISFGVERIFSILWKKKLAQSKDNIKSKEVDVFVMAVGDGLLIERMQVAKELWEAGLRVSNCEVLMTFTTGRARNSSLNDTLSPPPLPPLNYLRPSSCTRPSRKRDLSLTSSTGTKCLSR